MIKKIEIKNFKNIADQSIELSPYINSFVGENGSGKSSVIFKAPRLVLQNENWPLSKIKSGESTAEIYITTSKNTIKRTRSKTSTQVIINGVEYDGKKNVQSDIEALGFYNTTKLGKGVDLHFLKSVDILEFMPKSPESFYLKLSTIFNFSRIIDLKKEYSSLLKTTAKEVASLEKDKEGFCKEIEKLDAEILSLRVQLTYVEELEKLNSYKSCLLKLQQKDKVLIKLTDEHLKLKTTNVYKNLFDVLVCIKQLNSDLLKNNSKLDLSKSIRKINKINQLLTNSLQQSKTICNLTQKLAEATTEYEQLPRCPECKRVL